MAAAKPICKEHSPTATSWSSFRRWLGAKVAGTLRVPWPSSGNGTRSVRTTYRSQEGVMRWSVIGLIWYREIRDQLRDRRTVFMLVVLPIILYPLLGMGMVQFAILFSEQPMKIGIAGREVLETASAESPPAGRFQI